MPVINFLLALGVNTQVVNSVHVGDRLFNLLVIFLLNVLSLH
jgi:hypothetical protein